MSTNTKNDTADEEVAWLQEPLLPPETPESQPVTVDALVEDAPDVRLLDGSPSTHDDALAIPIDFVIDESGWDHGEVQPKACRDWFWGFLFLLHFVVVVTLAGLGIRNGVLSWFEQSHDTDDEPNDEVNQAFWFTLSITGSAIGVSVLLTALFLEAFATMLIRISLVISPIFFFIIFAGSFALSPPLAFFNLALSVFGICYARRVWHKIPFATANLNIALQAIKDNHGLWILAYVTTGCTYVWIFIWSCASAQLFRYSPDWIYDCISDDDNHNSDNCNLTNLGTFSVFAMFLSLVWTIQVIKNSAHTTIAGVIGTWWFNPEEAQSTAANGYGRLLGGCCGCSNAIRDSWKRSNFDSFGSICFGSFLVGILQVLRAMIRGGRRRRDEVRRLGASDLLCCMLQFLVDHLERLLEYFNTWAFVYVGLYGYDYLSAGSQVSTLFKARGWSVIINDYLLSRAMGLMVLFISIITGFVGMVLASYFLGVAKVGPGFLSGFFLGVSSCNVLFGVVTSAATTVIVCFAESPNQLRNNHGAQMFQDLVQAWKKAYPEDCGF